MKIEFLFIFLAIALASCNSLADNPQVTSPSVTTSEVAESLDQTPSSGIEPTVEISANETEFFSSGQLGLCFSYPKGYTQISFDDPILSVSIAAPDLPGTETKGRLSLEISDAYNRTAEEIADEDMTYAVDHAGASPKTWVVGP